MRVKRLFPPLVPGGIDLGSGFLLARSETVVAEFVEVHLDKVLAVFGCTTLLLLALLVIFSSFEFRATDTVTGE